jgi:PPOX class probable F420-dependent enzyme
MAGFIPWPTVDLTLRAGRTIWLSTTRPDGRPHAVPVWYVWAGHDLSFITRHDMQKARNLAHQPWVVAHAGSGDEVLILEGPATIVRDPAEVRRIDALYGAKYVDPATGAHDTIFQPHAALYRVAVVHVMAWAYGTVGTRTDWWFAAPADGSASGPGGGSA